VVRQQHPVQLRCTRRREFHLCVGVPAGFKRDLTPDVVSWLKKSAGNYVKYAQQYINDKWK